jgi:Flp pilus assembly protein TadG
LAELAVLIPILLVLVLVAADVGRLYFAYVTITNGARTGAAYASQSSANATNTSGINDAVQQDVSGLQSAPNVSSTTGTDSDGNQFTRVTVTYDFDMFFELPGFPDTITMTRAVQMRVRP